MNDGVPIDLSLVAVAWNDLEVLPALLESVLGQVDPDRTEIIFVDNGSTDGTLEYLQGRGEVTVIENGVNTGYPVAMNRGARIARGRFVALCNPDLVFRPGAIAALLDELESAPDIGGVSPVIEVPGNPPELCPLLHGDPGIYYGWNFFSGMMNRFAKSRLVNWNMDYDPDRNDRDIAWVHGCCGVFRREALASVGGGFDERFFIYFEDSDLGRTLRKRGWRLRMARGARVLHMEDQTCRRVATRSRVWFMESWHKYHRKHSPFPYRVVAGGVVTMALVFQILVQLAKLPFGRAHYLPVFWAYLRSHLSAPFRDLEAERRRELEDVKRRWKPLPASARSGSRSIDRVEAVS